MWLESRYYSHWDENYKPTSVENSGKKTEKENGEKTRLTIVSNVWGRELWSPLKFGTFGVWCVPLGVESEWGLVLFWGSIKGGKEGVLSKPGRPSDGAYRVFRSTTFFGKVWLNYTHTVVGRVVNWIINPPPR